VSDLFCRLCRYSEVGGGVVAVGPGRFPPVASVRCAAGGFSPRTGEFFFLGLQ